MIHPNTLSTMAKQNRRDIYRKQELLRMTANESQMAKDELNVVRIVTGFLKKLTARSQPTGEEIRL